MTQTIHFTKMQGAGNDYIYVDATRYDIPQPEQASIAWSRQHTGIGSDGLVLIGRSTLADADYSMRIFNADGSEAMMCGNASRCIGKYLYDKGLTNLTDIRLETKSGVKLLHLNLSDNGREAGLGERPVVESVTVDMLEPRTEVTEQFAGQTAVSPIYIIGVRPGLDGPGTFVSMGNPHYVVFVDDIEHIDVATLGRQLEYDTAFPERCNIEFAQITDKDTIRMRVWERGSGITQACGTGACATAVAAALNGLTGRCSQVVMDGGTLLIDWRSDNHVYMTGPAEFAFEGDITLKEI